jgi:hypothetical protein
MMIRLGRMYFWKFLESCDLDNLDEFAQSLGVALSEVAARRYSIEEADSATREALSRWSKGHFNAQELSLKYLRFSTVYRPDGDSDESWRATVSFTRIPHIAGSYSSSKNKHTLDSLTQHRLSDRLVELRLADVFARQEERPNVGTRTGLYVYNKIQCLPALKNLAANSRYTPQGSDLKELLQSVSGVFSEEGDGRKLIEVPCRRRAVRDFFEKCDGHVAARLTDEKLEALLQPVGISAKQWLSAGREGLLGRLGWGSGAR